MLNVINVGKASNYEANECQLSKYFKVWFGSKTIEQLHDLSFQKEKKNSWLKHLHFLSTATDGEATWELANEKAVGQQWRAYRRQ